MGLTLLIPVLATSLSVGLGCGACCSPAVSVFLSSYIITHAGGMKKSLLAFFSFFIGKVIAVVLLCTLAALIGSQFIDAAGYVGGVNLGLMMELAMIALGLVLIGKWLVDYKKPVNRSNPAHSCSGCTVEKKEKKNETRGADNAKGLIPLFSAGFAYGASPCAPLIMMMGVATTLPLVTAALVGGVFAAASTLTPVLLMVLLSGVLSGKIAKEIPQQLQWFRLASYVLLTLFSAGALINLI
ncbi:sulfite exporter TauE/SafE family protein [Acetobacterium sp.]|uniref:urease accessory protein UreH domain-containing protein n=1 Tax=Acetobacterium sp. TaxID=1872094 RepID=UPI0027225724|nr:sulfite exporter TauE/SafE family protein [Acetobacterium sp.]MDO9491236.1 sulfite exporter TauE/SafE family protein [Acetobacterium sp.]